MNSDPAHNAERGTAPASSGDARPGQQAPRDERAGTLEGAVQRAAEPAVAAAGLLLDGVQVAGGSPRVVRLFVDTTEGIDGPSLEELTALSGPLGDALDAGPFSGDEPYELEVSTPGAARELTEPRHWRRNVSRIVRARLRDGESLMGTVLEADENGVLVEPIKPGAKKGMPDKVLEPVRVLYASVDSAKVDVEATTARALKDLERNDR